MPPTVDELYLYPCHQCGAACRTGAYPDHLPALWYCRCDRPGSPGESLLLCDACHERHRCPSPAKGA